VSLPLLSEHRRVGIDSNVFIYLFEGTGWAADAAGALLDAIATGEGQGVIATLAIAEVGSGPARGGDLAMVERYADELSSLEGVQVVPLDTAVAVDAAMIRGVTSLTLADAVHLATARSAGATAFVTNDHRLSAAHGLTVAYLDDLLPTP
jgi:predicted nucleic acid-binding protein